MKILLGMSAVAGALLFIARRKSSSTIGKVGAAPQKRRYTNLEMAEQLAEADKKNKGFDLFLRKVMEGKPASEFKIHVAPCRMDMINRMLGRDETTAIDEIIIRPSNIRHVIEEHGNDDPPVTFLEMSQIPDLLNHGFPEMEVDTREQRLSSDAIRFSRAYGDIGLLLIICGDYIVYRHGKPTKEEVFKFELITEYIR